MKKNYLNIDLKEKFFFILISLIFLSLIYYHHGSDFLIYHPDYNTIYANIAEYLRTSKWNTSNWSTFAYQILPQKITAYTLLIFDFILGNKINFNSRNWIGFVFRLYLFLAALGTIFYTKKIYEFFFQKKSYLIYFLFYSSYIFYFCFLEIRNDGFYIFLLTTISYYCLIFYEIPKFKYVILISFLFSLSLLCRTNAVSLVLPFFVLGIILIYEKKIDLRIFLKYLIIFFLITILSYLFINGRNLEFYIKYYELSPHFKNFSETNFFQSHNGTKQFSIFWYIDYWFTSGIGIIMSMLTFFGIYNFLKFDGIKKNLKIIFFSIPISILMMISMQQVAADRYSFGLIPFIIFFSSLTLNELKKNGHKLNIIIYKFIIFFFILKILIWLFTFAQQSTRQKALNWIYENVPQGSGIYFINQYDWTSRALNELKNNYAVWLSPTSNINDISQLSNLGFNTYIHGENGFHIYYPEIRPFVIENKYAKGMNDYYQGLFSTFIQKTDMLKSFYNPIYESGLFHSKGYDTSNYLKDIYQPIITISKIKEDYKSINYYTFSAKALADNNYKLKIHENEILLELNKSDKNFEYIGPYVTLPKGKYDMEIDLVKIDNEKIDINIIGEVLNKKKIFEINDSIYDSKIIKKFFNIENVGNNQFGIKLVTEKSEVYVKNIKLKKID